MMTIVNVSIRKSVGLVLVLSCVIAAMLISALVSWLSLQPESKPSWLFVAGVIFILQSIIIVPFTMFVLHKKVLEPLDDMVEQLNQAEPDDHPLVRSFHHEWAMLAYGLDQWRGYNYKLRQEVLRLSVAIKDIDENVCDMATSLDQTTQSENERLDMLGLISKECSFNAFNVDNVTQKVSVDLESVDGDMSSAMNSMVVVRKTISQIEDVLMIITDLADQTNLLSLNASIEAASAGEYGRGFAVVADEVRKLAEKSYQATKEIMTIMNSSVQQVEKGSTVVEKASEKLKTVNQGMQEIRKEIQAITQGVFSNGRY